MGVIDRRKCLSHINMELTTWLPLVLAVLTFATPVLSAEPRVVCYYTNWSVYRPGTARFNPQNINPYLCTHLVYAFGGFTKDNTFKPFDKYQDIEKGGYAKFTGLKTYNKNLKTMLAIGGWNEGSSRFSPMVASRDRRKEFVRNAIKFLRQNHFDGLDLDWEYPAFRDGGKPKDRENYAKLVRELRDEFERESEKTGKPRLLLTMAVPAGIEYIQKGFDIETLNKYLDWMNLLSYDYHSAFEPAVNHHAPLYPLEEPNEYSVDNELNIDYTIKFYLENGADRNKLVLGIPTYGRSYTLFNPDAVEIGSPADGPGEQGDATREKGYLAYYEICEALKPKQKKRSISSDSEEYSDEEEEEEEEWTVMHPNPTAMGPVAFRGNQWVGYDDIDIVKKKAEYVAENGLGGIMFWSIDNDDFRGNCHGKPYPLIEAAKESYIQKLGSTDNIVVSEKPKSRGKSGRRNKRPRTTSTTTTTTTTTEKPSTRSSKRKSGSATSTTPAWNVTPEPPTTPDPGSDFKCTDEGFFPHPRDCKKYFWCLDSGPSDLGIVAHQFTCPSGLYFNKAADSCDFARNVLCKVTAATTKAPTKAPTTRTTVTTTTTTTTRKPLRISTRNSLLFRTTTTTPAPQVEEEYEDEDEEDNATDDAEDPKVIKELIELIKKVGGVEQLEKQLGLSETSISTSSDVATSTPSSFNKKLYQKVLERARGRGKFNTNGVTGSLSQNSRSGPQNEGLQPTADQDRFLKKDRPQYVTINRSRPPTSVTTENSLESEEIEDEEESEEQQLTRGRSAGGQSKVATTSKPLQYVNIRRSRPTTTVPDTADDSGSRNNALFERVEPYVSVSEAVNSLDITSARRENVPEYVTIRRTRPTSETTTAQYQNSETEVESQESALEREITSPSLQPQYTSVLRIRSTTLPPLEESSSPEPTTVLAVQISSLLNSPTAAEIPSSEPLSSISITTQEIEVPTTTATSPTTTTLPTTPSTTVTTEIPSTTTSRRNGLRRRGSTTTSTATTSSPTSTTQVPRTNFLRRTKPTTVPITTDSNTAAPDNVETTTNKYTRRGNSRFKSRKDAAEIVPQIEKTRENDTDVQTRRPFSNSDRPTPRNFAARRRFGGANSTSRTTSVSSTTAASISRRPFRVASRRRPATTKLTTSTTTTTQATTTTNVLDSDEYLQDIEEADSIEDPTITTRSGPKKNPKIQRRPLVNLKEESDQNPSATNEEEKKRQSKKYSSTFKQNQLDEVLKLKNQDSFDEDIDVTTEGKFTESFSAETAVALAAHKLLEAPVPIIPDYEYDVTPTRSAPKNTQKFKYTTTEYTPDITKTPSYPLSYSTTPSYSTETQDYFQTSTGLYSGDLVNTVLPSTGGYRGSKPTGFTAPTIINPGLSGVSRNLGPSTVRYLSTTEQNIPTQEINPTSGRFTDTSEKYSKSPSRLQDLTTVYNYSSISYDITPGDKYINTGESSQTVTPTGRSRGRRPSTTISGLEQYTGTSQTLPPTNDFGISKKYSEISRPTTTVNKYLDDRFTGISEDPFETSKYLDTSDKYTDTYQTPGPSTIDYLDLNRYTGTSQNLNPRFTVTGEKYTNVATNPSTPTYVTEDKYTTVSQEATPTNGYRGTTDYSETPINTRVPSRFTNRGASYTTLQNQNPTTTDPDTTDRYSSISRRRKPSTTTVSDSEKYTTVTLQTVNPTTSNERYTEPSRRRRPSTTAYTETDKYTTGTVQNVNPTEVVISTTEKPVQSRRRRPSTNSYTNSEQYTTETTPTFGFTGTSERYTSVPRRTRPSTSRYEVTEETSSEFSTAGPTTGFTGINERITETLPRLRPSTDSYAEAADKSTDTPQIETYTVNKKYSDITRNRSPSTSSYYESTEKNPTSSTLPEEVSTNRYLNPNGQYTGFIQDVNPSTVKYVSTEEKSQDTSPSSVQYPSTTGKYVSGPVDDFAFSTAGYSQSQDPSYFTREYLLASPVTKTYDDEYQYLSPVTTTQPTTTTRKLGRKKTIFRRISSTTRPSSTTTTTEKPRRVVSRKPFEKIRKVQKVKVLKVPKKEQEIQLIEEKPVKEVQPTQRQQIQRVPVKNIELPKPNRVRKPITYDYYDDSEEKVAQKYEEGTKVILHSKGTIECLDIGNFPHPSSCKKFISCARMESGALLGWEYVCPKGLSFDPVGGICNWSAGLGCHEQDS
ncbi:PREDICTED: mucin-5AC [Papilio polytes]|uniref:mucin-5AC n=1 Tax=Papilio polytes TaxID=76194 RepID=UPI000676B05B|nr:PREDICTED: mucin-5AC [Papilio polytes]